MKIKIKDLKPNPFRDMKNYPINEDKVKSLIKSIYQTGFWDNILARQNNGNIEIAYGHHRLIALQRNFKPEFIVNIPVKELDDSTMIRIMANENDESWGTNPKIIDETVRVTMAFLLKNPQIFPGKTGHGKKYIISGKDIVEFLDGNWNETRVYSSLERLGLIEKGSLDKEAVESMPRDKYARRFTSSAKKHKVTPEEQKRVAKRIVKNEEFSENAIEDAFLEEKYGKQEKRQEKERRFEDHLEKTTKKLNSLREDLKIILSYKDDIEPQFYQRQILFYSMMNTLKK